jgi:mono/diheme cytochrome c family protein
LCVTGCRHEKPNVIYMPDMAYSPALKAQQMNSMRMPVPGTVSRDHVPYHYAKDPEGAGRELKNPLRPTASVFARGKKQFQVNCAVCHGLGAEGDGSIIPKFPRPPSLHSDKVRNWPDGRIYHVVTMGQNLMPSYAGQVSPNDRWAIIHYIRALQRAKHPTPEDLKAFSEESH